MTSQELHIAKNIISLRSFQIREMSRLKLFGRPGHGAPTENIRKKKFTEYQLGEEEIRRHRDEPVE